VPEAGEYRVFVRTRDWVARWKAPGTPGQFQLLFNGQALPETLGTRGADWSWHEAGKVRLPAGPVKLALHDLTGFEGRCDAIVLNSEPAFTPPNEREALARFRNKALGLPEKPGDGGQYDLVVVGGGVSGCCAAITAARLGLRVVLVQNRFVLGGNSSSEIRVWIQGRFRVPPYPVIGEVVAELYTHPPTSPAPAHYFGDERKMKVVRAESKLNLRLGEHVERVEKNEDRIVAAVSTNLKTGHQTRYTGRWFVDASGDGTVGQLAGAASEVETRGHLGSSNMWYVEETTQPAPFPRCPWALDLTDKPFPTKLQQLGHWFWESGFDQDTVRDAEAIRDHNFRAMYGAWDCLKNVKGLYPNHRLAWAAYISGRRESRRLLGDVVLSKKDVLERKVFPDGCVATTWPIDLHLPDQKYRKAAPENPFIARAEFIHLKEPFLVPYRCLYSRNVSNLFMVGRCISVTHEALGTVRVMATGGLMGEVVGRAAWLCHRHDCNPRAVQENYLDEFLELLRKPTRPAVIKPPQFSVPVGANVARVASVTTSGERDAAQAPPSLLNDGLVDTTDNALRWLSKAEVPNWVECRWPSPRTLVAARVISGYAHQDTVADPIEDFVMQYRDGSSWRDIPGTITRGNGEVFWQREFAPITCDRVRLMAQKTKGHISRIWEIELYEPAQK
jgi:hypothetical protein